MVTWFAGLFYLPRLYVYHAMATDTIGIARFKIMERKLFWGIMTPGAILTIGFGFWLLYGYAWVAYKKFMWLHWKLFLVALLIGYHIYLGRLLYVFKHDKNKRSHVYYRILNELPVLALLAITILVIVKPIF